MGFAVAEVAERVATIALGLVGVNGFHLVTGFFESLRAFFGAVFGTREDNHALVAFFFKNG